LGWYAIKHNQNLATRGIKEAIRIIDARESETEYIRKKYSSFCDFIYIAARASFLVGSINACTIKCAYGFNQYAARDKIINHRLINEECLRCSRKEDWAHVIQYPHTFELKVEFIIELQTKLKRVKHEDVIDDKIEAIIYDIRQYLVNREEFLTNQ